MANCSNCGEKLGAKVNFCASCGEKVGAGGSRKKSQAAASTVSKKDAEENKVMAIIAYIIFFIPLLTGAHKTSSFVKYHTNQGLILAIAAIAYWIAYSILSMILLWIPVIGWIIMGLLGLCGFVFLILMVIGIINVVNAVNKPLPLIGNLFTLIK